MDWPADVLPAALRQPDRLSCGAASVVAARMLVQPRWRPADVETEVRRTHRRLTSLRNDRDRMQWPWPRRIGTPPWAVASAMTALTGERVATVNARPRPTVGYDVLVEQVRSRPVPVYVGNRWLPRHVVLAVAVVEPAVAVRVLDPARGTLVDVPNERWAAHALDLGGWSHFWFVV